MKVKVEIEGVNLDKIVRKEMSILMADESVLWGECKTANKQSALYKAAKLIKEYYK